MGSVLRFSYPMYRLSRWILFPAILIFAISTDRISKSIFAAIEPIQILPGILSTTHHQNTGLIANVPLPSFLIYILIITALLFLLIILARAILSKTNMDSYFLLLILGGALGNLWDRLQYGFVFDWILLFKTSILNLADLWIFIGLAGLFLLRIGHFEKR